MLLDILNIVATSGLAIAAVTVAKQANQITTRSIRIEADKHIFEWGQRCLNCLSRASSLRLMPDGQISTDEFTQKRQEIRAELFAMKEEGELFFLKDGTSQTEASLVALYEVTKCLHGQRFVAPTPDDYNNVREPQNKAIRIQTRAFVNSLQAKVGNEWMS